MAPTRPHPRTSTRPGARRRFGSVRQPARPLIIDRVARTTTTAVLAPREEVVLVQHRVHARASGTEESVGPPGAPTVVGEPVDADHCAATGGVDRLAGGVHHDADNGSSGVSAPWGLASGHQLRDGGDKHHRPAARYERRRVVRTTTTQDHPIGTEPNPEGAVETAPRTGTERQTSARLPLTPAPADCVRRPGIQGGSPKRAVLRDARHIAEVPRGDGYPGDSEGPVSSDDSGPPTVPKATGRPRLPWS